MKNKIQYLLLISLSILFTSCEKELDIDLPDASTQLVINSKVFQDSVFRVNVYRTALVNENRKNLWYIDSAKVSLYGNGAFIENLQLEELGLYTGQQRVKPHTNYEIKTEVDGFRTAVTKTKTLDRVEILHLDSLGTSIDPKTKATIYTFAVRFKDNKETKDYYMIDFTEDREIGGKSSEIYSKDPAIEVGGGGFTHPEGNTTYGSMYFSDELFNGKEYALSICVPEYKTLEGFTINLCHITPEYFKYIQTYEAQREADGMEIFFQAVQVYNNVENGLGIFGAISSYTQRYQHKWEGEDKSCSSFGVY